MAQIRLTGIYVRPNDPNDASKGTTTVQPGTTIDATDAEVERLLGLDVAVEVTGDEAVPDQAKADLEMLEGQYQRMQDEHKALEDAKNPDNVLALSASRIKAQERDIAKARERAGVKQPKRAKSSAPGADPAPADAQAAAAGVSPPTA